MSMVPITNLHQGECEEEIPVNSVFSHVFLIVRRLDRHQPTESQYPQWTGRLHRLDQANKYSINNNTSNDPISSSNVKGQQYSCHSDLYNDVTL